MQNDIYNINRTHSVNAEYFENISTEEQAYWLGFIWADGNICKTAKRSAGPNRLSIGQKITESKHIDLFNKAIDSDYQPRITSDRNGFKSYNLSINSRPICESLIKLGFNTKDKRIHIPKIPTNLLRHFIRGYFDGDGCLSIYSQKSGKYIINRQEWSLTGNPTLLDEIKNILTNEAHTTSNVQFKQYKRTNKVVTLRYGKQQDIEFLFDYLYKDSHIYLQTKYDKFKEYFSRKAGTAIS